MTDDFRRKYLERMEATIRQYGWAVQGVFPREGDEGLPFSYTVGLHDQGLPELLVFSLPPEIGVKLLNDIARQLMVNKTAGLPLQGSMTHENWPMSFFLLPTRPGSAAEFATAAMRRSHDEATVAQVVWPDKLGRFPWHPDATTSYLEAQPVLCTPPEV